MFLTLRGEALCIYSDGYKIGDEDRVLFSGGKYILTGNAGYISFAASCDLTFHDFTINAPASFGGPAMYNTADPDILVSVTAKGVNSVTSSKFCALYGILSFKLTVDKNSSISFSSLSGSYGCADGATNIVMADGSAVPGTEVDGWRNKTLTVSNGTPAAHNMVLTKSETSETHTASCTVCDFSYVFPCTLSSGYIDEKTCGRSCPCGRVDYAQSHTLYQSSSDDSAHYYYCTKCYTEIAEPHSFVYMPYDENRCIKQCDVCGYECGDPVEHIFDEELEFGYYADEEYCAIPCANCGGGLGSHTRKHDFSVLASNSEETCGYYCKYCGAYKSGSSIPHDFDDGVEVPATREEAPGTLYTCKNCGGTKKEYDQSKTVTIEVFSETAANCWDTSAVAVYVDGVPTRVIRQTDWGEVESYTMEYNPDSSYVFKWIKGTQDGNCGIKIRFPNDVEYGCEYEVGEMAGFNTLQTIYSVNCADYTAVDAAMAKIPERLENYSAESVNKLVTAVKGVQRMLPKSKQTDVDKMAAAVETAVSGLVELETPVPNGVINLAGGFSVGIDEEGYDIVNFDESVYESFTYSGKYVIFDSRSHDDGFSDTSNGIVVYGTNIEMDIINVSLAGDYHVNSALAVTGSLTLNPIGVNAFDGWFASSAGIAVSSGAKLTINDTDGSILAVGCMENAGIGGVYNSQMSSSDIGLFDCGELNIKGSTVFALSRYFGAGIGGSVIGTAGDITIDGGVIYAESFNYGAGIGNGAEKGPKGKGGNITINGGDVVALCIGKEGVGAGIGGTSITIKSITVNGGNIVAGSNYGAAVGAGNNSYGTGKIVINGGNISQSVLAGNDNNTLIGGSPIWKESSENFVEINGGVINDNSFYKIAPTPKNKDGKVLEKLVVEIKDEFVGKDIIITLSDGTTVKANSEDESFTIYAPDGTSVTKITFDDGAGDDDDGDDDMFWLWKFFLSIFEWFGSVFQKIGSFFAGLFA